jgi:hypothetical protein
MKYQVQISYTNPAHEHVSLRRRVDTVTRIVEARNELEAMNRAANQQRALGFMIREAKVLNGKSEEKTDVAVAKPEAEDDKDEKRIKSKLEAGKISPSQAAKMSGNKDLDEQLNGEEIEQIQEGNPENKEKKKEYVRGVGLKAMKAGKVDPARGHIPQRAGREELRKEEIEQVDESDVKSKPVLHKGKKIGETGIDTEASPGGGKWYAKHHKSGMNTAGFDSRKEAEAEVRAAHGIDEEVEQVDEVKLNTAVRALGQMKKKADDYYSSPEDKKRVNRFQNTIARKFGEKGAAVADKASSNVGNVERHSNPGDALGRRDQPKITPDSVMQKGGRQGKLRPGVLKDIKRSQKGKLYSLTSTTKPNLPEEVEQVDEGYVIHKGKHAPGAKSSLDGQTLYGVTVKDVYTNKKEAQAHADIINAGRGYKPEDHKNSLYAGVLYQVSPAKKIKEEVEQVDEANMRFDPEAAARPTSRDVKNFQMRDTNRRAAAASKKYIRRMTKLGGLGPNQTKKDTEAHMKAHFGEETGADKRDAGYKMSPAVRKAQGESDKLSKREPKNQAGTLAAKKARAAAEKLVNRAKGRVNKINVEPEMDTHAAYGASNVKV